MRTATILLAALTFALPLAAQADNDADREGYARELAEPLGASVIRNTDEARALPQDVAAVVSLSRLDDAAVQELKKRPKLKALVLGVWQSKDAWVTDAVLETLAGFGALEQLDLRVCPAVTGAGVGKLARLKTLRRLDILEGNPITPAHLAPFKKHGLTELGLSVPLGPTLFDVLATLPELRRLAVSGPVEAGDAPFKNVEKCKKLETIRLANTRIKPAALEALAKLKTLKALEFDQYSIMEWNDEGLNTLGKLKTLETLKLQGQAVIMLVSAKGFEKLHGLKALKRLEISWNFNGALTRAALAAWLANLPELEYLALTYLPGVDLDVIKSLPAPGKLTEVHFLCDDVTSEAFKAAIEAATGLRKLSIYTASLADDVAIDVLLAAPASLVSVEITDKSGNLVNVPYRVAEQRPELKVRVLRN
ncbi:MAG: hypothetical protein HS108_09715 [Planctomycetes bacterium]|jgi:hypothetical protein|nr:hypothetical protein [Planctomycetota bacterium]MCL4728888.1 hypothetical protein [Planctomycetota bacterium]